MPRGAGAPRATGQTSQVSSPGPAAKLPSAAQKLVGATVPGRVDFSGDNPAQVPGVGGGGGSSLQFYTRPAEKNAAATAVTIGRSLDVRG